MDNQFTLQFVYKNLVALKPVPLLKGCFSFLGNSFTDHLLHQSGSKLSWASGNNNAGLTRNNKRINH